MIKRIVKYLYSHKIWVTLFIFLVLVGVIYLPARIRKIILGAEAEYETVSPRVMDLTKMVDVSGKIMAKEQVTLRFQASGKLSWVGVKEGDQVKKWQAIASLDKTSLKKNLEKEIYDYLSERWDFEQSHEDYGTSGLPSEKWLLSDAAKRVLEKAQFDLNQTVLDLEIDQIAYDVATIYSPIDGVVIDIEEPVAGVNITPATAEFTIANPEVMIFKALVDEADIGLVRTGQDAVITLDAYSDQELKGIIGRIDFSSTATSGGGTAYAAEIVLPENEFLRFKIGMNGDAEIIIDERKKVLSLPLEAIKEKNSQTFAHLIVNRQVKEVPVEIGLTTETRAEIILGLDKNQKVIIGKKNPKKG